MAYLPLRRTQVVIAVYVGQRLAHQAQCLRGGHRWRWCLAIQQPVQHIEHVHLGRHAGLQGQLDSKAPPPPVTAPQALRLVREPLANVTRYDDLRTSEREVRHAS